MSDIARKLKSKRKILPNGCWKWTGCNSGKKDPSKLVYGFIWDASRVITTHRAAWVAYRGPIPTGKNVLHKCDFPLCFNPRHLFLGTQKDNVLDMVKKGRNFTATKAAGYTNPNWVKGEKNPRATITNKMVIRIRQLYQPLTKEFGQAALANKFKISKTMVGYIIHRKRWGHVK